jgi:lipid-A-disaccharide synthase
MTQNVFFSVGEPSGDLHAARLIAHMRNQADRIAIRGFGGCHMVAAGFQQDYDLTQLAVVGFVEVLPKLRQFFRCKDQAKQIFRNHHIDAVVLVDMPGFNWHIAAEAKKKNIPVFYYLPPQLWAWGQWRIKKMKRTVDHVICALPFERDFYLQHKMDATLVGHPFFEHAASHPIDQEWIQALKRENSQRVAVLPGSRRRELQKIWPLQIKAIQELARRFPSYVFDIACLNSAHAEICHTIYRESADADLPIRIHVGKTSELIEASTCVLMKSGSVSLELLARSKPACVMYHASVSTYTLAKLLSHARYITLPNIIADKPIVPEFIAIGKSDSVLSKIVDCMSELISNEKAREIQIHHLREVRSLCGTSEASAQAAEFILDRMGCKKSPAMFAA